MNNVLGEADTKKFAKLEVYGQKNNTFDDSTVINTDAKIQSIDIRCGEIIDCIKVNYEGVTTSPHGGDGGSPHSITFAPDEVLLEISGFYGTWWNVQVIKQLTFVTSKQTITFGMNIYPYASTPFSIKTPEEYPIIAFYGSQMTCEHGIYLSQIGAVVAVSELPDFYQQARNKLISTLYDPAFNLMTGKPGWSWTANDDIANGKFNNLKQSVTGVPNYYANPYEAQYFNSVMADIQKTDLFGFLQGLPKGAELHLHPSSMGDYTSLLNMAGDYQGDTCQVRFLYTDETKTKINPINTDTHSFQWLSKPNTDKVSNPLLGDYMNLKDALNDPTLKQASLDLMILNPIVMDYEGDMWDLFEPVFSRGGVLFAKTEIKSAYYQSAFEYLVKTDNLNHVEIRSVWNPANEQVAGTSENCIVTAAKNAGISLKVINFNSRHIDESTPISTSVLENVVNTGKSILNKSSEYLCAYDLVGEEDTGATTKFLINDFYVAFAQLGNYLPPFFFHDGESDLAPKFDPDNPINLSDPSVSYFNNNLVDAYLLNTMEFDGFKMSTNRVGHGLELFKSPKLFDDYKDANLTVELCPISNQLLRYVKDLREHPGQSYLAAGLPVSISADDPAIYGYQGISYDFWEAVIGWGLDLKMVKVLCYYSLTQSALSDDEKTSAISDWSAKWDAYITSYIK